MYGILLFSGMFLCTASCHVHFVLLGYWPLPLTIGILGTSYSFLKMKLLKTLWKIVLTLDVFYFWTSILVLQCLILSKNHIFCQTHAPNVLSSYQAVIGGTFYYILDIVIQLRIYNTKIDYVVYFQIWPHMYVYTARKIYRRFLKY